MSDAVSNAGYIYFVGEGWGRPVKIGWASDPARRLRELQIGSPYELSLLAVRPGTEAEERAAHKRFAAHRLMGEWFEWNDELEQFIRSLLTNERLSLVDVAAWVRVRPLRILREVRQGRLPCRAVAGEMYFEAADVEAWIAELGRYGEDGRDGRWRAA